MKNKNIDYADSIANLMKCNVSEVVKVQEYNLDDLTYLIRNLNEDEKEKVLENVINSQLEDLKQNSTIEEIRKVFKEVDDITDYFIKDYEDGSDIVSESDDITDDLLFKTMGHNGRTIELPINIQSIKNYCLSTCIKEEQLFDSLVWITLRLVTINYCVRYSDTLAEEDD